MGYRIGPGTGHPSMDWIGQSRIGPGTIGLGLTGQELEHHFGGLGLVGWGLVSALWDWDRAGEDWSLQTVQDSAAMLTPCCHSLQACRPANLQLYLKLISVICLHSVTCNATSLTSHTQLSASLSTSAHTFTETRYSCP